MMEYKKRVVDTLLNDQLECMGAVLIQGPKWCGKTTTAEQHAASVLYMDNPEQVGMNLQLAETQPSFLLDGKAPRLIDEWQLAPQLWDAARFAVDRRKALGQFIFTGSAVPADTSKMMHSGAGRFAWLRMRTLSLWESGDSNGEVSLRSLFEGTVPPACHAPELDLRSIASLICRGGWPGGLGLSERLAMKIPFNYIDAVCSTDISKVDGVRRDESFTRKLLRSYARNQGSQVTLSAIHADIMASEGAALTPESVASYVDALKKIFLIEDMPAWNPNLRSKTAIRTSDTRYFSDPSIACASLGVGPDDLMNDLNTMGLLFETLCARDLRVYADAMGGSVSHYRDKNGLEADAVVHLPNGRYGLVEVKLGGASAVDEGAKSLLRLSHKLDTSTMQQPSFLMVLTAVGDYAFLRPDGVRVVPIGCLRD